MKTIEASGLEPGERRLNGLQTTGREYRNLSPVEFAMERTNDVAIAMRDGTTLLADLFRPGAPGAFPVLLSVSPYPRQIQDFGLPLGFIEAGRSDFFVPRGYVHAIVNLRGTAGSGGTWTFQDHQEREDLYDLVEWAAAQPWCDGNVGMLGISYFAMTQLCAAVTRPPHLKAIFPLAVSGSPYDAAWHNGLLNSGFVSPWLSAVGMMGSKKPAAWRDEFFKVLKGVATLPQVHERLAHFNGEAITVILKDVMQGHYPEDPYGRIWQAICVEHPLHDAYWDDRDQDARLHDVDIPVYLGCDWDNVPMHLPSTFTAWRRLAHNPNVRVALLAPGSLSWPWEGMHYEVLAWYDHWLKGRDTGIMEGPPIRYVLPEAEGWRTSAVWPPKESRLQAFTLRADGVLGEADGALDDVEGTSAFRAYLYLPEGSGRLANANPPELPDVLTWETAPVTAPLDFAGNIELELDATISGIDTAWIAALFDVPPDGKPFAITAGWLRASYAQVDERRSAPGAPVVPCRASVPVPVGERVVYRIPIVPNARRIAAGHRLRLVVTSDDASHKDVAMLGFTHTTVREASLNTIYTTSRLLLPVLSS
jgi:putative CocE/NonD family hydrolase